MSFSLFEGCGTLGSSCGYLGWAVSSVYSHLPNDRTKRDPQQRVPGIFQSILGSRDGLGHIRLLYWTRRIAEQISIESSLDAAGETGIELVPRVNGDHVQLHRTSRASTQFGSWSHGETAERKVFHEFLNLFVFQSAGFAKDFLISIVPSILLHLMVEEPFSRVGKLISKGLTKKT
jgi:hypothetical protein